MGLFDRFIARLKLLEMRFRTHVQLNPGREDACANVHLDFLTCVVKRHTFIILHV